MIFFYLILNVLDRESQFFLSLVFSYVMTGTSYMFPVVPVVKTTPHTAVHHTMGLTFLDISLSSWELKRTLYILQRLTLFTLVRFLCTVFSFHVTSQFSDTQLHLL